MTPTRRSLATANSTIMGAANSTEADANPSKHLSSTGRAETPSKKGSPSSHKDSQPLKKQKPFSIPSTLDLFSRPRLPSFTAATTEVLRRLTGTPPLPLPEPDNEKVEPQAASSSASSVPVTSPALVQKPPSIPLPPPMITAAEAIKLRKEANARKTPGTPPLPVHIPTSPLPSMSRKRSAAKMDDGSSTPKETDQLTQNSFKKPKVDPESSSAVPTYAPFDIPIEVIPQAQPKPPTVASAATPTLPPPTQARIGRPPLGRPPKNRDPSSINVKKTRTPQGKKQRRSKDSDDKGKQNSSDSDSSSEDYAPQTTITKSGRQIHRPSAFQLPPLPEPSTASPSTSRPQPAKRAFRRKVGESSLCEHCLRGTSPNNNQIVFCDGCNRGWHQHCHNPVIEADVVREKEKEWFCGGCRKVKEPATLPVPKPVSVPAQVVAPLPPPPPQPPKPEDAPPLDMKGRIGGEAYSGQQVSNSQPHPNHS
jgi:hypothetical protein